MYGFRSTQAPESQNRPTLSTPNERNASGGLPALIAAICFSSVTPHFASTVIHGYSVSKPSLNEFCHSSHSRFEVHSPVIVTVTGSFDAAVSTVGAGSSPPPAVHAAATSATTAPSTSNRFIVPLLSRVRPRIVSPDVTYARAVVPVSRRHLPPREQTALRRLQRHEDRPVDRRLLLQHRDLDPGPERRDRSRAR